MDEWHVFNPVEYSKANTRDKFATLLLEKSALGV
jgi:hypothetical protein